MRDVPVSKDGKRPVCPRLSLTDSPRAISSANAPSHENSLTLRMIFEGAHSFGFFEKVRLFSPSAPSCLASNPDLADTDSLFRPNRIRNCSTANPLDFSRVRVSQD